MGTASKSGLALGATIDFLQTHGASRTVSNPSILCVNNKQSSIYVGKTIYVKSGTTSNAVSGVTDNYKADEVGLTLNIKPRVSSKDKVGLEVETVLENIVGESSSGHPITTKQEVKTQVILKNGESIIIGGLVKNYNKKTKSKVPLLGDIPWIGEYLFSSTSTTNEQDDLVVLLTPYIIDKSEKLSKLQKDLGKLKNLQKEYNEIVFKRLKEKNKKVVKQERKNVIPILGVN